ncbi:MAG TPA: phosphatidylglycerol lysyltransferase domain-containing protein, partial [Acidimicrobiales bacterium]
MRLAAAVLTVVVAGGQLAVAAAAEHPGRRGWPLVGPAVEAILSPRYLLLVASLVLLGSARGLLRGQRVASAVVLVVAALTMPAPPPRPERLVGYGLHVLLLVVLVAGWESFDVRSDARHQRRGLAMLAGGLAVVLVYGTLGLYLLDSQFDASTTFGESLLGSLRLLFLLPIDTIAPRTSRGMWFLGSVRVMAVLVVLAAVSQLTMTVIERERQRRRDRPAVEAIVRRWGTTSLAPFQLTADKSWVLSDDRRSFLAYRVVGRVALALGGPTGPPAHAPLVLAAFCDRCQRNGWVPAFHQLDHDGVALVASAGFKTVKIGEEAVIDLADFDLRDAHWKSLRSALRRVQRSGLEVVELSPPIDDATLAELRQVSDAWLAVDGHRERSFTLGQFDDDYLRSCPVLAVAGTDGGIAAFTNLVPSYASTNGNFDLMRRRPDAPNGVMDALYVGLIEHYRRAGAAGLTLGLAPLARLDGSGVADHALRIVADHGDRAFHFAGLRRFKEKWRPRWEPRYTAYRYDADLPRVALALTRAGELPQHGRLRSSAQHLVTTYPFTIALVSVVTWFMSATAISAATFRSLLRRFGLAWRDLVHLQVWRLPASQLLQPHPGFV